MTSVLVTTKYFVVKSNLDHMFSFMIYSTTLHESCINELNMNILNYLFFFHQ